MFQTVYSFNSYKIQGVVKKSIPGCLHFWFIKIIQENFVIFNKIRIVYATVYQLWSNTHQLKKIPIIMTNLFFFILLVYFIFILFLWYTFDAIKIHPRNKHLFFRLIFIFFDRFWKSFQVVIYFFKRRLFFRNIIKKGSWLFIVCWIFRSQIKYYFIDVLCLCTLCFTN